MIQSSRNFSKINKFSHYCTMKHPCSTPFANIYQKCKLSYDLPKDVVNFIESTYNEDEQRNVKKKLNMLSSNLHATILSNTTRAISNCVDGVLRAIYDDEIVVAPQNFNPGSIQFKDLLDASFLSPAEKKDQAVCKETVVAQDPVTSTQEMIKELIYHYMETSFPPIPEVIIPELSKPELLSTKEIFEEVVQNLKERGIQEESDFLSMTNVDDYLAKSLVTKLDISNYDDGYQEMSILGLEGNSVKRNIRCTHAVSLNEMLAGCSLPQHTENNGSEFPSWSFGEEFEIAESPTTLVASKMARDDSTAYVSSQRDKMEHHGHENSTGSNQYPSFNKSTYEPSVILPQPSATTLQKNKFHTHLNAFPPLKDLEDIFEDAWGWERILPQDDFCSMPFYLNYLKEYLWRNGTDYVTAADGTSNPENWPLEIREVGAVTEGRRNGKDALTTAAEFQFMSEYESQPICNVNVKLLSERIQERACYVIHMGREFSEPAAASLVCIANEAALASELLRHGAKATDNAFILCNYIRQCALSLMYIEGPYSDASAAAMVGVAKEAKMIREWMVTKKELFLFGTYTRYHEMGLCDSVRTSTFGVMKYILSNSTGNKKSFVVMDFREIMQESKRQKTMPEASDKKISQGEKVTFGKQSVEQLGNMLVKWLARNVGVTIRSVMGS
ncbi:hypothetical protein ACQ4PT_014313 [Festuca glaucescens]